MRASGSDHAASVGRDMPFAYQAKGRNDPGESYPMPEGEHRPDATMDTNPENITDITKAIQLALAPVFLLTGIAGLLNVMTGRLARIVDRGRALTERRAVGASSSPESVDQELRNLIRRRHFTSVAITGSTIAALLLCLTIAILFLEVVLHARLNWLIGTFFTFSTLALVVSLASFLREVHLAMQTGGFRNPAQPSAARDQSGKEDGGGA
jgi:cobalamin biosynthesis protein CobD/CbiB